MGWRFYNINRSKKMLKIETETFYIFKHVHKKTEPLQMKIRYPIGAYYDGLSINEYKNPYV